MSETEFEVQLKAIAAGMEYPRTPDIAGSVTARHRRLTRPRFVSKAVAWSLTLVLILLSSIMLIPSARAAIVEFFQVGVVRILRDENNPTQEQVPLFPVTATPVSTSQPLLSILQGLAGEITLQDAKTAVDYEILLPTYPPDLGLPDHVFIQDADGPMTILVWLDPQQPGNIRMSLHFLPAGSWAIKKIDPVVVQETQVNGDYAIWTTGPYPLRLQNGDIQFLRMVEGHVLIWEEGRVTYRLETDLLLDEALKIAESLESLP